MPLNGDEFSQALVTNGQAWLVLSLSAILPMMWAFTLIMHFARPYMLRLTNLRRVTWPSVWPLLQGRVTAAFTAA